MINNINDVKNIYSHNHYMADNIVSIESNDYIFEIKYKTDVITAGYVRRIYEKNIVYHE